MNINSRAAAPVRLPVTFVFCIALCARVALVLFFLPRVTVEQIWGTGYECVHVAISFVSGHGFSSPFGVASGPTSWPPPLYTFLIIGIFKTFGTTSIASAYALTIINAVAESTAAALACLIGEKYLGHYVGFTAGILFAIWPYEMFFCFRIWDTSFTTLLILVGVYFSLLLKEKPTTRNWIIWGALCGISTLMSFQIVVVLALTTLLVIVNDKTTARRALLAAAITLSIISPWTIRNALIFHRFIPVRANFGEELWIGNKPNAPNDGGEVIHPLSSGAELAAYVQLGEDSFLKNKTRESMQFIVSDPARFARLTAIRVSEFWSAPDFNSWRVISVLALSGLMFLVMTRNAITSRVAVVLLAFPVPYYITHSEGWYRHPIDPIMLLVATFLIFSAYHLTAKTRHKPGAVLGERE